MLIDCHVHLNNYHAGQLVPTAEHCAELFAKMDERGVDHAVVLTSYRVSADRPGVEEVLSILDKNPRVTGAEGLRWRGENRTDLFAVEERIRDGLVRGIKLYPSMLPRQSPRATKTPRTARPLSLARPLASARVRHYTRR